MFYVIVNRIRMKKILLVVVVLGFVFGANAQPMRDSIAFVVRSDDGEALKNATVVIRNIAGKILTKGMTDSSGIFRSAISQEARKVSVEISCVSFIPLAISLELPLPEWERVREIRMKPDIMNLNAITVLSKKPFITMQPDRYIINIEGKTQAGNNAADILKKSPGISIIDGQVYYEGKPVLLQVNGKNVPLEGKELLNYLTANATTGLGQIELITTPPSSMDASFAGAVINLKLMTGKNGGLNGSSSIEAGYRSQYPLANADINLNFRKGKLNMFMNGGTYTGKKVSATRNRRFFEFPGISQVVEENSNGLFDPNGVYYSVGVDFSISARTITGLLFTGYYDVTKGLDNSNSFIFNNGELDSTQLFISAKRNRTALNVLNYNIKSKLDSTGQELNFDFDYNFINTKNTGGQFNNYRTPMGVEYKSSNSLDQETVSDPRLLGLKADYKKPVKTGTFESGIKFVHSRINYELGEKRTISIPYSQSAVSDSFDYVENIYSAYASFAGKAKKFDYRIGLRAEGTQIDGYSYVLNQPISSTYFNVFPTASILKKLNPKNSISLSFRRSISRPRFSQLNPFKYYLSPFAYYTGNPDLRPYFPYSLRINWSHNNKVQAFLSYTFSKNRISEISSYDPSSGLTRSIKENNGDANSLYFGFTYYGNLTKWWYTNNFFSASYGKTVFNENPGKRSLENTVFSLSSSQRFTINEKTTIEVMGYVSSGSYFDVTFTKPYWFMDLSVYRSVAKGNGELSLKVRDIFFSNITRTETQFAGAYYTTRNQWDSRSFSLAFFYRFGNKNVQENRQRNNTATTDERNRTN